MATPHGKRLLQSLLADPKGTEKYIQFGLTEDFFQGQEIDLYEKVTEHVEKYGRLPKPQTLDVNIPEEIETPEYYLDHVQTRYTHRTLVRGIKEAGSLIQGKATDEALDVLRKAVIDLTVVKHRTSMIEFAADAGKIIDDEYQMLTKLGNPGILTGMPSVDNMMNGLRGGDVMVLVGRPEQGKTYNMLYMAHNAWHQQQKRVLFVSMEMKPLPLIQRTVAIHEKRAITLLRKAEYSKKSHKALLHSLSKYSDSHDKFWVIDGNLAATVQDVLILCHQLQPDVVFIDGAYLMHTSDDRRMQRWDRIGTTLELVKQDISTALGIPCILSYQFNKEGAKKKDLENIGGTDIIGQIASCVLALWEKEDGDAAYTARKKIDIIKGRNGEKGEFFINWIFDQPPFMNFDEVDEDEGKAKQMDAYL